MDDHLIGYLLNSLDPVTHHRVEAYLQAHPDARARLDLLEQALAPLAEDEDPPAPPPGLVLATLTRIAEHRCGLAHGAAADAASARRAGAPLGQSSRLGGGGGDVSPAWRTADPAHGPAVARTAAPGLREQPAQVLGGPARLRRPLRQRIPSRRGRRAKGGRRRLRSHAERLRSGPGREHRLSRPGRTGAASLHGGGTRALYQDAPDEFRAVARDLAGHYAYCLGYADGELLRGLRAATAATACPSWPTAPEKTPATAATTAGPVRTSCTSAATSAGACCPRWDSTATTFTSTTTSTSAPASAAPTPSSRPATSSLRAVVSGQLKTGALRDVPPGSFFVFY